MDASYLGEMFSGMIRFFFILGVIAALVVGGLVWGGVSLYRNYRVVKVERNVAVTNVITITNYVK